MLVRGAFFAARESSRLHSPRGVDLMLVAEVRRAKKRSLGFQKSTEYAFSL